jgi:hypothetical protein
MCDSDTNEKFGTSDFVIQVERCWVRTVCAVLSVVPDGAPVTGKLHVQLVKLFLFLEA